MIITTASIFWIYSYCWCLYCIEFQFYDFPWVGSLKKIKFIINFYFFISFSVITNDFKPESVVKPDIFAFWMEGKLQLMRSTTVDWARELSHIAAFSFRSLIILEHFEVRLTALLIFLMIWQLHVDSAQQNLTVLKVWSECALTIESRWDAVRESWTCDVGVSELWMRYSANVFCW